MSTEIPGKIKKEAGLLLSSIYLGVINIPQLKSFLAKVASLEATSRRKTSSSKERVQRLITELK